ncbi:MAG: hypothetical protein IT244_13895 [Bacteroidia bacterium]|nr:hypothetical protein [Bacteroidia bacterium]
MSFEFITVAPIWYALFCAAGAGVLTWLLYRKHFFESRILAKVMMVLRFLALFILFLLLLSPMVKLRYQKEKKPILAVYLDASLSIDSAQNLKVLNGLKKQTPELAKLYDIRFFDFNSDVTLPGKGNAFKNSTNISAVIDHANEFIGNHQSGQVLIVSDGLSNTGVNPLFRTLHSNIQLSAWGLGDTVQYPDAWVQEVNANSTVFLGNELAVSAGIRAYNLQGKAASIQLFENGKLLQTKNLTINNTSFFGRVDFGVKSTSPGNKRYEVRIPVLAGESNAKNNAANTWVQVTDTRRKIQLCYHSPHPDIAAISRAIEGFEQYELSKVQGPSAANLNADIYILHGFASNPAEQEFVASLQKKGLSTWFVLTGQCEPVFCNFKETGIEPKFQGGSFTDAQAAVNSGFTEYTVADEFASAVASWPPLKVPYGRYEMPKMFKTQLYQKIGAVQTDYPLMGFTNTGNARQAWLWGEGVWRWRMRDHQINGSAEAFDNWIAGLIQYLSVDDVKQKFRVFPEKPEFHAGENAVVLAEYIDEGLNMDNSNPVNLVVTSNNGFNKSLPMAKNGKRYRVDLGEIPSGDYECKAQIKGKLNEAAINRFSVTEFNPELDQTVADHGLLRKLANRNRGQFFNYNTYQEGLKSLANGKNIKTVLTTETNLLELIHWKWLFALLVLLFGTEWFLRKREGGY